jgi:flagellin
MTDVTLTAAMRSNLLSLQSTADLLGQTQLRLATGNKVNSALDNPISFFAAQTLNNRASDLGALLDGMGQSIQVLQATSQGITSATSYVQQLKSLANSAKSALNTTTTVNTLMTAGGNGSGLDSLSVADLTDTNGTVGATAGDSFSLQDSTGVAHTFVVDTLANGGVGTSLQDVVTAINAVDGFTATIVYGDGVTQSSKDAAGGTPSGGVMQLGQAYLKVSTTDGGTITAVEGNATLLADLGLDLTSAAVTNGGSAATQIASYDDVLAQLDQTIADANYQGTNLINGTGADMTVQVNEKGTGALTVASVDLTAVAGLSLDADASSWTSAGNIDTAIAKIDAALATLRAKSGSFASSLSIIQTRQDFTKNLINTLKDGASQLTIADKNEEGANMLALQTAQQLGIQSLALASQANQSVLRLFA